MGGVQSTPITDKSTATDEDERVVCGHSTMQGYRDSILMISLIFFFRCTVFPVFLNQGP